MDSRNNMKNDTTSQTAPPVYTSNPELPQAPVIMAPQPPFWRRSLTWGALAAILGASFLISIIFIIPIVTYARVPHDDSMVVGRDLSKRYLVTETVLPSSDIQGTTIITQTSTTMTTTTILETTKCNLTETVTSTISAPPSNHFFTVTVTANKTVIPPGHSAWSSAHAGPPYRNSTAMSATSSISPHTSRHSTDVPKSTMAEALSQPPTSTSIHSSLAPTTASTQLPTSGSGKTLSPSSSHARPMSSVGTSSIPAAVSIVSSAFKSSPVSMPPPASTHPPYTTPAPVSTHVVYSTTTAAPVPPSPYSTILTSTRPDGGVMIYATIIDPNKPPSTSTSVVVLPPSTTTLAPNTVSAVAKSSNVVQPTSGAQCDWSNCKPTRMNIGQCRFDDACAPVGDGLQCACLCDSGYCDNWHGLPCSELNCCINCGCTTDPTAIRYAKVGCWNEPTHT